METVIPENIKDASNDEITAIEASLVAEFDKHYDAGSTDVALLTEIAEALEVVRVELAERETAQAEAAEKIAELADRVRTVATDDDADATDDTEEVQEFEVEDASEDAPEAEVQETTAETEEVEAQVEERELVTASGADKTATKSPSARAVARRSATPEAPKEQPMVTITAAADVPGFAGGVTLDKIGMAKAMHAKARTLSNGSGMVPVATINVPIEHKLGVDASYNMEVLDKVTDPASLTAAGWCAPSNNLYTLFGVDAGDGLIDLPTVQVTRGGLNVPSFIGLGEASGALWTWTEDSAEEEETKQCLYIPCPDFTDYRLRAEGLCLTHGNLTDRAFPELTARFIALAINAHLHRVSAAIINDITGTAVGVTMNAVASSAAGSILHAIDVQVADYRSQYRMAVGTVLEAVFPLWTKEVVRADLALRTGVSLTNVSDGDIDAHFATRRVRAQFVHDYQPMYSGAEAQAFPTSLDFLIYPAGGYVRGDGGTIDLGVVRDSVLNATNDYTAAWTEQLFLVAQLGPAAREVTVNYGVDGVTGCCPTAS
jgi:hypothetical protein